MKLKYASLFFALLTRCYQVCRADGLNVENLTESEAEYAKLYWEYEPINRVLPSGDELKASVHARALSYSFVVPLTERLAGITYVGHAARLRLVLERAIAGEALLVGSLGGSITYGLSVAGPNRTYAAMFVDWLNAALPPKGSESAGFATGTAVAGGPLRTLTWAGEASGGSTIGSGSTHGGGRGPLTRTDLVTYKAAVEKSAPWAVATAREVSSRRRKRRLLSEGSSKWDLAEPLRRQQQGDESGEEGHLKRAGPQQRPTLEPRLFEEPLEALHRDSQAADQAHKTALQQELPLPSSKGGPGRRATGGSPGSPARSALLAAGDDERSASEGAEAAAGLAGSSSPAVGSGARALRHLTRHLYVNGAIPGTQSSYASSCLNYHLPRDADLIFLEYAVNDPQLPSKDFSHPVRRALERLVRKLLRLPSRPAVVVVNMFAHGAADGQYLNNPERDFMELATYYSLPSVSLKAAVMPSIDTPGGPSSPALALRAIYNGGINHPGRGGHVVVVEVLITLALGLLGSNSMPHLGSSGPGAGDPTGGLDPELKKMLEAAADRPLPAPLVSGNYESSSSTCYLEDHLQALAFQPVSGWTWTDEGRGKWGWVATEVGQVLRLKLNTHLQTDAADRASRAPILVQVAYLQSYSGAGTAEVKCESGCSCQTTLVDSFNPRPVSLTDMTNIQVSQDPHCILSLTTKGPSHAARKANKAKKRAAARGGKGGPSPEPSSAKFKLMAVVLGEEPGASTEEGTVTSLRGTTFEAFHALHQVLS